MDKRNLKLIDGSIITIELNSLELENHFNDTRNCTKEILTQFNDQDYYNKFIDKNDKIILDLGANIGLFALHISPWAKKIYCVEPTPNHFNLLTKLTESYSNINRIQGAISDKTGTDIFYSFFSNTTMNSLINRGENSFEVNSYSIKDLIQSLKLKKVDFIKMDIEGSETIALNEDVISFMSNIVSKILIEFHEVGGVGYTEQRAIFEQIFIKYGYEIKHFGPDGLFCLKL